MTLCSVLLLALLIAFSPASVSAQGVEFSLIQPPQANATRVDLPAGYPVTGRMICADTQRAARFAQVNLIPASGDRNGFGRRMSARTDLDGNFLVNNVPSGDYYVTGVLTGYVNQSQLVERSLSAASTDPGAASALNGIPVVHVSAGGASTTLSLQRGAVVSGTVQWDDGTPAAGVSVSAQPAQADGSGSTGAGQLFAGPRGFNPSFFGAFAGTQTDDRGRFRLSGLAPGSYYIHANIVAPAPPRADDRGFSRTLVIAVYAPDKVRRTDAAPVVLSAGEERPDLNLVVGLAGMHTVSGVVGSSGAAVRSGSVTLSDQTDTSLTRNGVINGDGSFTIPYVPAGTYTLRVNASAQLPSSGRGNGSGSDATTRFQPLQESLTVADADLSGLTVNVTQATTASN